MKGTMIMMSLCTLMCIHSALYAGDRKDDIDKRMEKAATLVSVEKYDDAEKVLQDLVLKYPDYGKAWDKLAEVRVKLYKQAKSMDNIVLSGKMTVSEKGTDGKTVQLNDSAAAKWIDVIDAIKPSKRAFNKLMLGCRLACLHSDDAWMCAVRLRTTYVDAPTDTNINEDGLKYFKKAEFEFQERNYNTAAEYYQKSIDADPTSYKARLYLGDTYYMTKRYTEAIKVFVDAVASHPDQLEPRKYLTDAYYHAGMYDKAYATSVDAVILYPDLSMVAKLIDAAETDKKKFHMHRIDRAVLPNQMGDTTTQAYIDEEQYHTADKKSCWKYYTEAKNKIAAHCDANGIISGAGDITKQRYAEVYCWEYMLSKSNDKELDFARKMQSKGYLDCYALVSCFHQDFYGQYKHFTDGNKQRVRDYFEVLQKEE